MDLSKTIFRTLALLGGFALGGAAQADITYPFTDDFESDPFSSSRWSRAVESGDTVDWSTTQAASPTHSLYIDRPAGSYTDATSLYTPLLGVPQTGNVELSFDLYLTIAPTGNVNQFAHIGNNVSQVVDGYKVLTLAYFPSGQLQAFDSTGGGSWFDTGRTANDHLNKWVNHRIVFHQDSSTYDYFITVEGGSEEQLVNGRTAYGRLGAAPYDYFTSIPFNGGNAHYLDNFSIQPAGGGGPTYSTLFEDDFNAGTVDPQKWAIYNGDQFAVPVDLGGGDFAISLTDSANGTSGFSTIPSFQRGDSIRATFRVWHAVTLSYTTINGPWVSTNDPGNQGWTYPALNWVEAGIGGQDSGQTNPPFGYAEGVVAFGYVPMDNQPFMPAWRNATSKASSILVRVTLGDATGAMTEFSTDNGATFQGMTTDLGPVIDTRGLPADEPIYANQKVSSNQTVYVGFGGGNDQPTFIDDVKVEWLGDPIVPPVNSAKSWTLY